MFLTKNNHSLLAAVFWAVEYKDAMGLLAVFNKELCLVLSLGEVFNNYSWADLICKWLYQGQNEWVVVICTYSTWLYEITVID
jgi:hypothetical protein